MSARFLLAIDPGLDTGWAIISEGMLVNAGLGLPPELAGSAVIIERPQIYRGRSSKADPNDLITLAIQVGRYTERYAARGQTVEHVLPHTWKGTVDADVLCRRIVASLDIHERTMLETCLAPVAKGKRHNVIDAVGIGKWSLKRTRAAVF